MNNEMEANLQNSALLGDIVQGRIDRERRERFPTAVEIVEELE